MKKNLLKYFVFLLAFFPVFSFAQINFSEIMFDPEGADTDREWVEIKNTSGSSINLEKYKFCDSGSCHKLYESGTDFKIPGNSFGIIAKKPEKFKTDYPNFSGFILRASFSLTNSKELLELKNKNGEVISVVEYNVEVGGKDGNTFSLFGDIWKNGKATPNGKNIFKEPQKKEEKKDSGSSSSSSDDSVKIDRTYVEISDMIDGKKKLKAEIIDNIPTLIAGAENEFNGRAYGITGIEIRGAEYFWTLGDGEREYGKNIRHTFLYPGDYVLTLIVKSANFTGNTRKIVRVVEPNIEILDVDSQKNWIKLKNNYSDILKLDGWFLFVDGDKFKIPKETYILGGKEIIFPNEITNLDVRENSNIFLLFPNEQKVTKFVKKDETILRNLSEKTEKDKDIEDGNFSKEEKKYKKSKKIKVSSKIRKDNTQSDQKITKYFNNERNFVPGVLEENKSKNLDQNKIGNQKIFNNLEKVETLKINQKRNFWRENFYFIDFIFLVVTLVMISVFLNYFENKNKAEDKLSREAEKYSIEEL